MTFQGENSSLTLVFSCSPSVIFHFFFLLGGFVLEPVHWPRALPCTCAVLCSKYRTNLWGWKPSQHLSLPTFLWENELRRSNIKFRFSPKTFTHELECLGSLLLRLDFLPPCYHFSTFSRSVLQEEIHPNLEITVDDRDRFLPSNHTSPKGPFW